MESAAGNPNPAVSLRLLLSGASLTDRNNNGVTPLIAAAIGTKNPEVITVLLKAGADIKARDNSGKAAFDYAQRNASLRGTDVLKALKKALDN